jgi:hypothetical protein
MKRLMILIIGVSVLWGGYWFVGASGLKSGVSGWLEARRDQGWQAEWSDITVQGFPNRFDTTLSDLALADPETGWAWQAPFFQLLALSYKPNHVIVVWPDTQTLQTPLETLTLTGSKSQGSVVLAANTALTLERTSLVFDDLEIASDLGWSMGAEQLRLATEPGIAANSHRIGIEAIRLRLPVALPAALGGLSGTQHPPEQFASLSGDATVAFSAPWDRFAIEVARPQPTRVDIRKLSATWGQLNLSLAGGFDVDATGSPTGEIVIKARNWREIVDIGAQSGAIPETLLPSLIRVLELAQRFSGNAQTLDIPLRFRGGRTFFGPLPIAAAPRFVLR